MVVSRMGIPQSEEKLRLVTFQKAELKGKFRFSTDVILTIALVVMVLLIWILFSPIGIAN